VSGLSVPTTSSAGTGLLKKTRHVFELGVIGLIDEFNMKTYDNVIIDVSILVSIFFFENTGELRFIVLKRRGGPQQDPHSYEDQI